LLQSLHRNILPLHLELWLRKWILGRCICNGTYNQFTYEGQKNWLGYEKRSLTLLPEDYLGNGSFCLPSFSISLILFSNHNGFIDHVFEISVICVEQLELNVIVQPIQKHVLLLLICIDVICDVSRQLNE
jgi:hypothetical protein